jgi:hypothetical protein
LSPKYPVIRSPLRWGNLGTKEYFRKNNRPEDMYCFFAIPVLHQGKKCLGSLGSCHDTDPFRPCDKLILLHHRKIGKNIIVGDIQEFRKSSCGGKFYGKCVFGKVQGKRLLFDQLDPDCRIKNRFNRFQINPVKYRLSSILLEKENDPDFSAFSFRRRGFLQNR